MFTLNYPIQNLRGAEYNPRHIGEDELEKLRESIALLGMAKPVIANPSGMIVAGHQRTKALLAIGENDVPTFILDVDSTMTDEVTFNQLHNGTDLDSGEENATIPPSQLNKQYAEVPPKAIQGNMRAKGATIRNSVCRLIMRYGLWGCAIATQSGKIINGAQYALSCKILNKPCRVFVIPDELEEKAAYYLNLQYGTFYYEHLKRETYAQTYVQPRRLRSEQSKSASNLYEEHAMPMLQANPNLRMLDFGCGQADYLSVVRKRGYKAYGIEFFFRKGEMLDTQRAHQMMDEALDSLATEGRFDIVLCDFVINATDTLEALNDVMTCINLFLKPGGVALFSGRSKEIVDAMQRSTIHASQSTGLEFMDEHGLSGQMIKGNWTYMRFHYKKEALALAHQYINGIPSQVNYKKGSAWWIYTTKNITLSEADCILALKREFELPWPGGRTVGRSEKAIQAFKAALQLEN